MSSFTDNMKKLDRLHLYPSDKFAVQIMMMVQQKVIDCRDNEAFKDWTMEKIVKLNEIHKKTNQ